MALPVISKQRRLFANMATCWIPIKKWRKFARGVLLMGYWRWRRVIKAEQTRTFKHQLAVAAIMKDEAPYVKEWIEYHLLVGVEKFYIYDNGSTDDTPNILAQYAKRGIVEYKKLPGSNKQNTAYIDAINCHAEDTRWLACIDVDEFLVPVKHKSVPEFLESLPRNFGAVITTWVGYGSSGHVKKPDGLVIENFKYHARQQHGIKSIMNPRLIVEQRNPHINRFAAFIVDEYGHRLSRINQTHNPPSYDIIRCNHYAIRSWDECLARCAKGDVVSGAINDAKQRFAQWDKNEVYSDIMDKYIKIRKEKNI